MERRVISNERQWHIKSRLPMLRKTATALHNRSWQLSKKARTETLEIDCIRKEAAPLEAEITRYLDELNGHGPAHLLDQCAKVETTFRFVEHNLKAAEENAASQ